MIEQEPVGWINKHNLESIAQEGAGNVWNKPYFDGDIPLYTYSMRELTDEEITQCLNESMDIKDVWGQPMSELNPFNFARAILRKASEK